MTDENRIECSRECGVHGTEFEVSQGIFKMRRACTGELIAELVPGLLRRGIEGAPVEEDAGLISVEREREAVSGEVTSPDEIFEAGKRVGPGEDGVGSVVGEGKAQGIPERLLADCAGRLVSVGDRLADDAAGGTVNVVIDDERT